MKGKHHEVKSCNRLCIDCETSPFGTQASTFFPWIQQLPLSLPFAVFSPGWRDSDSYSTICFGLRKEGVRRLSHCTTIICLNVSFQIRLGTLKTRAVFLFMFISLSSWCFRGKLWLNECSLVHRINKGYKCSLFKQRKWKFTKMVIRRKSELSWFNGNKVFQSVGLMFGVRRLIGKVKIESFQQGDRALN